MDDFAGWCIRIIVVRQLEYSPNDSVFAGMVERSGVLLVQLGRG